MKRNLLLASGILFALYLVFRDQAPFEARTGGENGNAGVEDSLDSDETAPLFEPTQHLATDVI